MEVKDSLGSSIKKKKRTIPDKKSSREGIIEKA